MKKNIHFIILLVISFILIIGSNAQRLEKAAFLSKTLYFPFINSVKKIEEIRKIKQKNILLELELAAQTIKVNRLENLLEKFRELPVENEIENLDFKLADIIGYSGSFADRCFIVNKGKSNGIQQDNPVISANGIVGKIISVSHNFAIVMPIDHVNFKSAVMTKSGKLQGLLKADIYGDIFLTMIKVGSAINLGDTIVTSSISTIFPKNLPVGIVSKIDEAPDNVHIEAKITPFIDPATLDQVIILFYKKDKSYETELTN